jgi:hypothetical protein
MPSVQKKFLVTIIGDEAAIASLDECPYLMKELFLPQHGIYTMSYHSSTKVGCDDCFMMGTWNLTKLHAERDETAENIEAVSMQKQRSLSINF